MPCPMPCAHTDKLALYEFVVRHFLASCSKDAVGFETSVAIDIAGEGFRTTGAWGCWCAHCGVCQGCASALRRASIACMWECIRATGAWGWLLVRKPLRMWRRAFVSWRTLALLHAAHTHTHRAQHTAYTHTHTHTITPPTAIAELQRPLHCSNQSFITRL